MKLRIWGWSSDIEPDERKPIKQSGKTRNETEVSARVSARVQRKIDNATNEA
jgi:hypothetical protein